MAGKNSGRDRFAVFREADAPVLHETDAMQIEGATSELADAFKAMDEAGMNDGQLVKLLYSVPGMSLSYVWFKSGFPLPRHSHNADCLYYIIGGSLTLGSQTLGKGDGFFVAADAGYTYTPGPDGVEVLEFRNASHFNIRMLPATPEFWTKAIDTVGKEHPAWIDQERPSEKLAHC